MAFRFSISRKIASGYFVILFIISITSIVSILELAANKAKYNEIANIYQPSVSSLKEFDALSKEANKLIENWVRVAKKEERDRLKTIQSDDYPALRAQIENLAEVSGNTILQKKLDALLKGYDENIVFQKRIMKKLETPENYSSDTIIDAAFNILDNKITPGFAESQNNLKLILASETNSLNILEKELDQSYNYLASIMILILAIIIVVGSAASYLATRSISRPIVGLKNVITSLGKGDIPEVTSVERDDEIGEITEAIHAMIKSIKLKTEFAIQTGGGSYAAEFMPGEKDILGNALLVMRDNLKHTAEADAGRSWLNAGLARAGELLRIDRERGESFYSDIITFLSEYLNAGMGGLYILNEDDKNDSYLELTAAYAFETVNNEKRKIALGQGLTGQAAIEKKIILLKDIPPGYMKIMSGLGETQPKNIVIVPLVFENELKGLIELATIEEFTDLHIEFLEKTAKNIAITFDLAGRKARTEFLLTESRQLNEQLKLSQEKLTSANEELSTFVYKASHDLRGPLSTMLGLINLALDEPGEKIDIEVIQAISETANKLDKILHVLIRTMSIKDAALNTEEINFKTKIQDVLLKLKEEKHMARIRVITNIENHRQFKSDNEILGYILHNLFENAIKFQDFSIPESFAMIDIKDYAGGVQINITDNGIGINNSLKNKVFEMFFRGNAVSGSGLGLYFVKNAITKLEGRIELISQEGVGTVFSIYLPSLSLEEKIAANNVTSI